MWTFHLQLIPEQLPQVSHAKILITILSHLDRNLFNTKQNKAKNNGAMVLDKLPACQSWSPLPAGLFQELHSLIEHLAYPVMWQALV